MYLSIVTTLYESAQYLREFCGRICAAAGQITDDYEVILVNDGSPDDSLEVALSLYEDNQRIRIVDLSRNFGHHRAIMTGLSQAQGELVFLIDCDLEEKPELLLEFHDAIERSGADVVFGVQAARRGRTFDRLCGRAFYKLFSLLSTDPIPENVMTVRLMRADYVAALSQHREREFIIAGLWAITGFRQEPITVDKGCKGTTSYSLARRISIFVNAVTSFSDKPLVMIFYLGTVIVAAASIAAGWLLVRKLFFGAMLGGWPSLIVSVWLLGGLTIFCLGVIGVYLSKIFRETKRRPYSIIRRLYCHSTGEQS